MIHVSNLVKEFHNGEIDVMALRSLSFDVPAGQFLAITGRSGSGKSTLLYQLGLLDTPTSGVIHLDGTDVLALSSQARTTFRLNALGYVFQDYAILPTLTALENVMLPLLMQGSEPAVASSLALSALTKVGLADRANNLPSQMSGGQQQRVSIARALAHSPKIIFADEPTANLDSETSRTVIDTFLELNRDGQTIVMVTHEPEYAALCDRIITLSDGAIVSDVTK
jgi:putative ABC transport system ATP-binding protein